MSILTEKIGALVRDLGRRLVPHDCLLCSAATEDALLCAACLADLPHLPRPACPVCALPGAAELPCGRCQRHPPQFDRLIAAFPYAFPVDRLIQQLKYGHRLALADWFGMHLAAACRNTGADLIVPMPLHPARLTERGFNQALEIARPLSRYSSIALDATACRRIRATAPQEGLNLRQRRRNLKNAFLCPRPLDGRHILLVDDVATTGASADECARTLRLHGATRVTVAVVARTLLD